MIQFICPFCDQQSSAPPEYTGLTGPCPNCRKLITFPLHKAGAPAAHALKPSQGGWAMPGAVYWVLGLLATCGLGCLCLLPATRGSRGAARRTQCVNNLKQIGLALHNYHDTNGAFPPAYTVDEDGNRLHSWRVLILPYIEQNNLYEQIRLDEPWNSPHNRTVMAEMPETFRCPSNVAEGPYTSYLAIDIVDGVFNGAAQTEISQITDGTSSTIMVVENSEKKVRWNQPLDFTPEEILPTNSYHSLGSNALFADGSVHFLLETIDRQTFRRLVTKSDGRPIGEF